MQHVANWLEKLGLGQYAQRFAENDIDFALLTKLTDANLKELGDFLGSLKAGKEEADGRVERYRHIRPDRDWPCRAPG
jgi:SAM domain (Sterile alpha motif)